MMDSMASAMLDACEREAEIAEIAWLAGVPEDDVFLVIGLMAGGEGDSERELLGELRRRLAAGEAWPTAVGRLPTDDPGEAASDD